jgi:hypothetical protein
MIIHMIGNAHIDPVWLWRWPEGMSEMTSTCRTMVKMLNESDDLIYSNRVCPPCFDPLFASGKVLLFQSSIT